MPFAASGGGGAVSAGAPVTMQVEPGAILALKARYEAVRDTVQDFLNNQGYHLRGRRLADDDVSFEAAEVFARNSEIAIKVTTQFIDELNANIDQLARAAETYHLVEEANSNVMRQENRGI